MRRPGTGQEILLLLLLWHRYISLGGTQGNPGLQCVGHAAYRWYYAKGITADEAYVFVCYDSRRNLARITPHTGFIDPTTPADAEARHSIETRAFVFWEDEPEQEVA